MNDRSPTPTEQAKIKAWDEAVEYCNKNCKGGDHTYSVAHAAYLAGHASRDKEIEELWQGIEILNKEKREYIHKAACLQSDLNLAKKENDEFKARINELESSNIVFGQTVAIEPVTDTEGQKGQSC